MQMGLYWAGCLLRKVMQLLRENQWLPNTWCTDYGDVFKKIMLLFQISIKKIFIDTTVNLLKAVKTFHREAAGEY